MFVVVDDNEIEKRVRVVIANSKLSDWNASVIAGTEWERKERRGGGIRIWFIESEDEWERGINIDGVSEK